MEQSPLIPGQGDGVEAFFQRCGVHPTTTRDRCISLAAALFPGQDIQEAAAQGYCSYTLIINSANRVLQFRPPAHKLDIKVARAACKIYGVLAPDTQLLTVLEVCNTASGSSKVAVAVSADEGVDIEDAEAGKICFDVICMERIPGIQLSDYFHDLHDSSEAQRPPAQMILQQQKALVSDFARFIAMGWKNQRLQQKSNAWPSSDIDTGKIGASMQWRLEQMSHHLPERFRPLARTILCRLDEIKALPWVLTHGDIVPANIMVEQQQRLKEHNDDGIIRSSARNAVSMAGLLDWAEAEWLPFGVALYGLDELLGTTDSSGRFAYHLQARELYDHFWTCLAHEMPEFDLLSPMSEFRRAVDAAHALGVLLWHGIAFDNGKLNRVVDEVEDWQEVRRLDVFWNSNFMEVTTRNANDAALSVSENVNSLKGRGRAVVTVRTWGRRLPLLDLFSGSRRTAHA